jgi:hydrogenase maturation protease
MSVWDELERRGPDSVVVGGVELRRGSRVRLRPRAGGDIFDLALAGRVATVHSIEEDVDGTIQLAVTVDAAQPERRFFFTPAEVEPFDGPRILVAGIGNVFLGDDGFGVELARRLADGPLPDGVEVVDFGIRGMDLAYALLDGYDAVVLLDAAPRGEPPGTLYVIEADVEAADVAPEAHGMDPVNVLALARSLGGTPPRTLVVGCEPRTRMSADGEEVVGELSEPVRAALDEAERLVASVLGELTKGGSHERAAPAPARGAGRPGPRDRGDGT